MLTQKIATAALGSAFEKKARTLATKLGLALTQPDDVSYTYLLLVSERLSLRPIGKQTPGPITVDFTSGATAHRRQYGGGRGQLIAKAVGLKKGECPRVLDATAGLGQDAFVLACLGCEVTMIERSGVVAALVEDALVCAKEDVDVARLTLVHADAIDYLKTQSGRDYDVVYLDPMYPTDNKTAASKKEMQILRDIVGDDEDVDRLLEVALSVAKKRVVVKRPRLAVTIKGPTPDLVLKGKSSRYDVYFPYNMRQEDSSSGKFS